MLKWLILGVAVALVSHWSSKEVHADNPLSEDELRELQSELSQLEQLEELDESEDSDLDKRDEDGNYCEYCQFADDQDACEAECEDDQYRRMIEKFAQIQEANQGAMLENENGQSKKGLFRRRRSGGGRWWRRIRWEKVKEKVKDIIPIIWNRRKK